MNGMDNFKSAIDYAPLTDDVKLTYLETLVTGKAKVAIAEFAYCGAMYKDAFKTLERKFGQLHALVTAYCAENAQQREYHKLLCNCQFVSWCIPIAQLQPRPVKCITSRSSSSKAPANHEGGLVDAHREA